MWNTTTRCDCGTLWHNYRPHTQFDLSLHSNTTTYHLKPLTVFPTYNNDLEQIIFETELYLSYYEYSLSPTTSS